jgi:hypothetical protein
METHGGHFSKPLPADAGGEAVLSPGATKRGIPRIDRAKLLR